MSITTEQLLESVHGMSDDQLQDFTKRVLRLNASRRSAALSPAETQLLKDINRPLPADRVARYRELLGKRDAITLSSDEHRELRDLSDWLEEWHAERLAAIAELARLRGVTLAAMTDQLGLTHLVDFS